VRVGLRFYYTYTSDGTEPPNPTPDSIEGVANGTFPDVATTATKFGISVDSRWDYEPPEDRRTKVLVALYAQNGTASMGGFELQRLGGWRFSVKDAGPVTADTGVRNNTQPGDPAIGDDTKRTYISRWRANGVTNYQGTTVSNPGGGASRMGQGRVA